jgi:hypothetical protein
MDVSEHREHLLALRGDDVLAREQAAWALASTGEVQDVRTVLETMERPEFERDSSLISVVVEALSQSMPASLDPVISYVIEHPLSPGGRTATAVLAEVAAQECAAENHRLIAALVRVIEEASSVGTDSCPEAITALQECAKAGDLPEVRPALLALLVRAANETSPYMPALRVATTILAGATDDSLLDRLKVLRASVPEHHPLRQALNAIEKQ